MCSTGSQRPGMSTRHRDGSSPTWDTPETSVMVGTWCRSRRPTKHGISVIRRYTAAGSAVTVEPGVYLPDRGGVRIEDTLVVGEGAPDLLTRFPKELAIL